MYNDWCWMSSIGNITPVMHIRCRFIHCTFTSNHNFIKLVPRISSSSPTLPPAVSPIRSSDDGVLTTTTRGATEGGFTLDHLKPLPNSSQFIGDEVLVWLSSCRWDYLFLSPARVVSLVLFGAEVCQIIHKSGWLVLLVELCKLLFKRFQIF